MTQHESTTNAGRRSRGLERHCFWANAEEMARYRESAKMHGITLRAWIGLAMAWWCSAGQKPKHEHSCKGDCGGVFICGRCGIPCGNCFGAADEQPAVCDGCWEEPA
jgi:hypothetical protein